jgi:transcriptional regulator GlxA family with amidase domain
MSRLEGDDMTNPAIRIGILGFEGIMALDLVGPMETFAAATQIGIGGAPAHCYETIVIGQTGNPFTAESGLTMQPHCALADAPTLDTLIVPGGVGLRRPETLAAIVPWLKERAAGTRRVASVCTGIYGLAETGLLDGRRVTTHWGFTRAVARQYPKLRVDGNAIFIRDNRFYTSAGVTAGIDLSLALIEEDFGARLALSVARELVVFLKRPGGQEQYSEPLQFQAQSTGWACLSPRQFGRRFKAAFGTTPADFVEEMRLNEARHRLGQPGSSIENVALSVGFRSADVFRRAFERRFGSTPTAYRERFDSGLQPDRRGPSRAVELPATV